jgi:hypothetical protein
VRLVASGPSARQSVPSALEGPMELAVAKQAFAGRERWGVGERSASDWRGLMELWELSEPEEPLALREPRGESEPVVAQAVQRAWVRWEE